MGCTCRSSSLTACNTLWQHGALVQSIAFDDPWMAAAMDDGATLLLNADAAMRGGRASGLPGRAALSAPPGGSIAVKRQFPGSGPAYCVDIADQWLACGSGMSRLSVSSHLCDLCNSSQLLEPTTRLCFAHQTGQVDTKPDEAEP